MFKISERLYDDMAETLQNDYFELFYVPTMIANRLLRNRFCGRSYGSVILVVHTILKNMPPCKYFILISLSVKVGRPAHSSLSVARFLLVSLVNFWQFIAIAKGRGRRIYCPFSAHLCGLRPIIISSVTYRARLIRWQINEPVESDSKELQDRILGFLLVRDQTSSNAFALFLQLHFPWPSYQPPGLIVSIAISSLPFTFLTPATKLRHKRLRQLYSRLLLTGPFRSPVCITLGYRHRSLQVGRQQFQ